VAEALLKRASAAEALGMRGIADATLARSYPEHLRTGNEARQAYEAYLARFISNDPTSYACIVRGLVNIDLTPAMAAIECPTLFISGKHDVVRPPADTAAVSKTVRGARFLEVEGGHVPSVQAPAALADALITSFSLPN
jgi:3-oxoadipate enol-lactonase